MPPQIMVVDNNQTIRAMFSFITQHEGWTISGYSYANVNLATIQSLNPDLIVLDFIEYRIGEGWEFLQLLKMEESTAAIPIIISTTMVNLPPEIKGYLVSRDISVLSKPFDAADFLSMARQVLNGQSTLLLSATKRRSILLVEDNPQVSSGFITILQMEGFPVDTVPNGKLALQAVMHRRHSLIFTDIQMPVMTGLEFIAAYALQPGPHTPTVIFSAQSDLQLETLPPFVIGRLSKPFVVDELLAFVTRYAVPV